MIAVTLNIISKIYPIEILMQHEIIDDNLNGTQIVISFCPLCNTGIVFKSTVDGFLYYLQLPDVYVSVT